MDLQADKILQSLSTLIFAIDLVML